MNELKTTTKLVQKVLEEQPHTRNSDGYLYIEVLKVIGNKKHINLVGMPVGQLLCNLTELGVPTIETVGRCRRRVQGKHPELCADAEFEFFRSEREEAFREYARG